MNINPEILILARESRGLTQTGLERASGVKQSDISKLENGIREVSSEVLVKLATSLSYPVSLFSSSDYNMSYGSSCLHHRKRQSMPVLKLRQIHALINMMSLQIGRLLRSVEIDSPFSIPKFDISDAAGDPETIAALVRRAWRIPMGPIRNLVAIIELSGAIIVPFIFGTRKLDAISLWPFGLPPLLFVNTEMPWERIRFSLAHEIGHLVMHQTPSIDQEAEANKFASAFLMPKEDIIGDLSNISIPKAVQLKSYWKVSMQALIMRSYLLKRITESRYRRLFTEISKQGFRTNEPNPLPSETPTTLDGLIKTHLVDHEYSLPELCDLLDLHMEDFELQYRPRTAGSIRIVK